MGRTIRVRWRVAVLVLSVAVACLGFAGPASADGDLADKPSSQLMSLLPDDAIPADWKVEKDDLAGATSSGDQLCHQAGDANGAKVNFLVRLQALSHCTESVDVLYGKENPGVDMIAWAKSIVPAQGFNTLETGTASVQISSAPGPNTAPYPSVTALMRPTDMDQEIPGQLVTWVRVRGLLVVVRSFAWDAGEGRARLDQVVHSAIGKLKAV
ncbi:hypothetical protein [Mycobacteroides franklinii]|uniref:hypothetical protein n=1 Tax=Mycobacteroides franklinii TaxID=948102 RepID=UPI0013E8D72B